MVKIDWFPFFRHRVIFGFFVRRKMNNLTYMYDGPWVLKWKWNWLDEDTPWHRCWAWETWRLERKAKRELQPPRWYND